MNAPVSAGDEIFNSYDSNLPNSTLLARYGFILQGNEYDYISWDTTHLPPAIQGCVRAPSEDPVEIWTEELLDKTSLVYDSSNALTSSVHANSTSRGRSSAYTRLHFRINSDGLISVDLWIAAAVCSIKVLGNNSSGASLKSSLEQLARAQVYLEINEDDAKDAGISSTTLLELKILANLVQDLCGSRLEGMYRPELSVAECGDFLDVSLLFRHLGKYFFMANTAALSAFLATWYGPEWQWRKP